MTGSLPQALDRTKFSLPRRRTPEDLTAMASESSAATAALTLCA